MLAAALAGVVLQSGAGSFDATFGSRGIVRTRIATDAVAWSVAIQRDGKIVVGGTAEQGAIEIGALARYKPNGSLDRSFGQSGTVTTPPGAALALALQSDGRILIAGARVGDNSSAMMLLRYTTRGSPDPTFGDRGMVTAHIGRYANALALAVQPDHRVVVGGSSDGDFVILRYLPDGSIDRTFGSGGVAKASFGGRDAIRSLVLQPNGKIIAVGTVDCGHYCYRMALARFEPDGSLDAQFGSGGMVTTHIQGRDIANAAVRQRDGRIVVAGASAPPLGATDFALVRYRQDGSMDTSFGDGGSVVAPLDGSYAFGLAIQRDGKLVVAGNSVGTSGEGGEFAVARFRPAGLLDPTFAQGGVANSDLTRGDDYAMDVAVQRNGKIVAVGAADAYGKHGGFAVVRYRVR